ncbi:hypothetical protein BGZ65_005231 [Modicella reniformis]|uniref:Uncharacterized protein n=1 Tax=Modicella reniformis TaxID=1440133 RepID=A0A9P6SL98_9FUNG|nr:hypothetical protein BGZ65_005231 [Modicella reniformis]
MNLSRPRGGRYETLAVNDDQDLEDLQSVLTTSELDRSAGPSLQKRSTSHSTNEAGDDYGDDNYSHYSETSDTEKPFHHNTASSTNGLFSDQPKLTLCNRIFLGVFGVFIVIWVAFALYLGVGRISDDGVYSTINSDGDIILTSMDGSEPRALLPAANVTDVHGARIPFFSFLVSPDEKYVLLGTNRLKQWRHSFNATYYIYNLESYKLTPLLESVGEPGVEHVAWSPVGHTLAYVQNNNLLIYQDMVHRRQITFDGAPSIFNGITDWVYEEEVYSSPSALWWSPDGTSIAFLRFDETDVPEFHFSLFMDNQLDAPSYPRDVMMKYPKVGFPNPIVNLHLYSLNAAIVPTEAQPLDPIKLDHVFEPNNRIIAEVKWVTDGAGALLVKVQNRVQNHEKLVLVNPPTLTGKIVREWNAGEEDGGWIDMRQSILNVAPSKAVPQGGYLDIANNNGYNHIALYTPIDNPSAKWLTSGEWEVQSIEAVDQNKGIVFFISTEKSSVERHLYSVTMDSVDKKSLTDVTQPGYYSTSFSTGAGYYLLTYGGPDVPWQKVKKVADEQFNKCNYMEYLPPGFSPDQKHPVLFQVYGGPNSQTVDTKFQLGFSAVMSSVEKLKYIVVVVDGRGSSQRGRAFKISVVNQLGKFEAEDQIAAGRHWKTLPYVDPNRMAIWGWSYGGFLAAKVTEANSGVFKAAISVAPVSDFRFYDSIYTERYMNLLPANLKGYETTAVTDMTGFNNTDFLLVHGTGDDNVHVQNAMVLIDRLTLAGNHRYKSHFFTDSDHRIQNHNANHEIYWLLTETLWETTGVLNRQKIMDLLVIQATDRHGTLAQNDHCIVHPDTMLELRVPALGLIAVQDRLLFGGATLYLRCLPCETIPQGSIRFGPYYVDQVSGHDLYHVHVQGISSSQYRELRSGQ